MSLDIFKKILDKIPRPLTQVAFGIGDIDGNPDLDNMFHYCRQKEIIPNVTINGSRMTDRDYDHLMKCGAVAVSHYDDDLCFSAVKNLTDLGMQQVNIHKLLCEDTYEGCIELMEKYKTDIRLDKLNAIVFLLMKPKGKRNDLKQLKSMYLYEKLIEYAFDNNTPIGFDSCSAPSFLRTVKEHKDYDKLKELAEPCESSCFSSYINIKGRYFHCSFTEGQEGWEGVDVIDKDFLREVWNSEEVKKFRNELLKNDRKCPIFDIEMKD
jgi:hypothetical protein